MQTGLCPNKITYDEICKVGEGKSIREADIAIADLLKERMGVGELEFNADDFSD